MSSDRSAGPASDADGDVVVRAAGLGKLYRFGPPVPVTHALLETARRAWRRNGAAAGAPGDAPPGHFWALREVALEVRRGEALGIVGRNGSGKSTLLKILGRITSPTEGTGGVRGRVGALLELGTGFHPELTGRENVFLNGVVLGMRQAEVARRFDEIVAFAGVEAFVDSPVKHFSTGMQMRLAFAVAVHLPVEVLLMDEGLAVGDAGFQKRCLAKLSALVREGRTLLLVGHNLTAIRTVCTRALWLDKGKVVRAGAVEEVSEAYAAAATGGAALQPLPAPGVRSG